MADYAVILGDIWTEFAPFIILGVFFLGAFIIRFYRKRKLKKQAPVGVGNKPIAKVPAHQQPVQGIMPQGGNQPQYGNPAQPVMPAQPTQQAPPNMVPQTAPPVAKVPEPQPEPEPVKVKKPEVDFRSVFDGTAGTRQPTEEEFIHTMTDIAMKMEKATEDIDKNLDKELHSLSARLVDVNMRKEQIRKYGKQLAKMFETYEEQEQQLATTITSLERLVTEKKKQQREDEANVFKQT